MVDKPRTAGGDRDSGYDGAPGAAVSVRLIAGMVALIILITFLLQNLQEVDVNFLWFSWSTRMIWALIASAAIGGIGTIAFATIRRRERSRDP